MTPERHGFTPKDNKDAKGGGAKGKGGSKGKAGGHPDDPDMPAPGGGDEDGGWVGAGVWW